MFINRAVYETKEIRGFGAVSVKVPGEGVIFVQNFLSTCVSVVSASSSQPPMGAPSVFSSSTPVAVTEVWKGTDLITLKFGYVHCFAPDS